MKKLKNLLLWLLAFVFLFNVTMTAGTNVNLTRPISYKDPFLAGVLSWVMPGAGQIYAHSYTKGSLFILGNLLDKTALVLLVLYLNNNYSHGDIAKINWTQLKDSEKGLIIGYAVLSSAFKVYNSLDAVYSAKQFNSHAFTLRLEGQQDRNELQVSLGMTFPLKDF